jgi:glycosyltransferase involved in cell wall biosynthesis
MLRLRLRVERRARRATVAVSRRLLRVELGVIRCAIQGYRLLYVSELSLLARVWGVYRLGARKLGPVTYYTDYARSVLPALCEFDPDVVHAHDLNTLHVARRYCRRHGIPFVYDAHEHELHRNTTWTPLKRAAAAYHEFRGIRAAAASITVSAGIAGDLERWYRIPRPHLVMNSPPLEASLRSASYSLKDAVGLGPEDKLVVYVGKVMRARGVEEVVEALPLMLPNVHLGLLGPRASEPEAALLLRAAELGCSGRVHLLDSLPPELVPAAIATADASIIPIQNVCRSYDLAMPNKLFDAVMAGVPILVSDLREMRRFVTEHQLGTVFDERDPLAIARAVADMLLQPPAGVADREALAALQRSIAWETQAEVLGQLYAALPPRDGALRVPAVYGPTRPRRGFGAFAKSSGIWSSGGRR